MIFLSLARPFCIRTQYACCIHLTMFCNPRSFFQPPHGRGPTQVRGCWLMLSAVCFRPQDLFSH
jgi:hypothetical protein